MLNIIDGGIEVALGGDIMAFAAGLEGGTFGVGTIIAVPLGLFGAYLVVDGGNKVATAASETASDLVARKKYKEGSKLCRKL